MQPSARISSMVLVATLVAGSANAYLIDTVSYDGQWYGLLDYATGADAEAEAVSLGGHLATINSLDEQQFLWDYWGDDIGCGYGLWIGLNDVATEGSYEWFDGQPVDFTYWDWDEPNNGEGLYEEDYVVMDVRWIDEGFWNDVPDEGPGFELARGIVELSEPPPEPPPAPAPEPSTLLLLASGLLGLRLSRPNHGKS